MKKVVFKNYKGEIYETMKPKAGVMTQLIAEVVRNDGMY